MAKRKSTPAPTLASLRKLAKRKGFNPLEVELFENLAHGWTASTDSREDLSVRVFAVTEDKAARTFELCLSALPDVVPTERGHHGHGFASVMTSS